MQKIFTLCLLVFLSLSANAQFKKGDKVLGAGLNFQSSTHENNFSTLPQTNKSTNFDLSVEIGMAKKENRLNGFFISAGYGVNKQEYPTQPASNSKNDNFNAGVGYFSKCYKPLGKSFFVFGEGRAGLNYFQVNNNINTSNPDTHEYRVNLGLYPGLAYKWNSRFLFELRFADFVSVGYFRREVKGINDTKDVQRNFSLGTSLGLGYLSNIGIGARWIM